MNIFRGKKTDELKQADKAAQLQLRQAIAENQAAFQRLIAVLEKVGTR